MYQWCYSRTYVFFLRDAEFLAAMVNAGKMEREVDMKKAFQHFDEDGNGLISRNELTKVRGGGTQKLQQEYTSVRIAWQLIERPDGDTVFVVFSCDVQLF